jgi:hypothetical protein
MEGFLVESHPDFHVMRNELYLVGAEMKTCNSEIGYVLSIRVRNCPY